MRITKRTLCVLAAAVLLAGGALTGCGAPVDRPANCSTDQDDD